MTLDLSHILAYNPLDWYWQARDGRVYSSKRNALVYSYDSALIAFKASNGGTVTPWPIDIDGNQTTAALQAVVSQYGITLSF